MQAPAVTTGDGPLPAGPAHPIVLVLDRLRSAYNVGNIFRLAEICRLECIITCGYTATPPHPKLEKTARGCDRLVPCRHAESSVAALAELHAAGYHVVGVETAPSAPPVWGGQWPYPVAFVFGNEALGIAPEALAACDSLVRLPVYGSKNSLNVGNCAAVVVYEAIRRLHPTAP
jgi:tRNA G18 (ribose-2'-O)-methylase SpoU